MSGRILIIGLGDIGRRLAAGLAQLGSKEVRELIVAGRCVAGGASLAALLAACGETVVRFAPLDAGRPSAIESLLRRERPDIVVQCASLLSPWYLSACRSEQAATLRAAGFAAQLPAQLPLVTNLMKAVRGTDFQGAVINCSYPDVTHPILARAELAPTIGLGNVSMILARIRAFLRERDASVNEDGSHADLPPVRVLAHHAHVTSTVLSQPQDGVELRPRVYLGEEMRRADELAYSAPPLLSNPSLNALSAASSLPVIRAFLPGSAPLHTSAPGPRGLPGGYPLLITNGQVELDLPPGLGLDEAVAFQHRCARLDGVEAISDDGTVIFTEATQEALRKLDPSLAEPLAPSQAEQRFRLIESLLHAAER
ncbi:MAG TPA: hypothetical protein VHU19_09675 [Pyrinomonadaceae bacterium]|jgi:hypothetical protein|nr:hypothetical protein [Pyrinomonadaceae bacterium]